MKLLKYLGIIVAVLLVLGISTCAFFSKSLPEGIDSPKTEQMVSEMWDVLNKDAWDTTRYVSWSFPGGHHYKWDKESNLAEISWKKNRVLLDPDKINGVAYFDGEKQNEASAQKLIDKAWSFWCNDMFWLTAPFKVKDPGTSLSLVENDSGDRLKVSYDSGGVTPGDSYIWIFEETGAPKAFEMYVKILPVKGLEVPWSEWETLTTGAKLCSTHEMLGKEMKLKNIKGGMQMSDIGVSKDIWAEIR